MSVIRIASRYAKSLLDLANEQKVMPEVVSDMETFIKMVENRDLLLLLKSPIVTIGKKAEIFKVLFEGRFNKLTSAFLNIILRKGREAYLPEIAKEFINQYKYQKGISSVKITSATPLSNDVIEKIKEKLLSSVITDQSIEIETAVDESLIGGFVIQVGDNLVDASVSYKLKEMAKALTNKEYEKAF